MKYDVVVGLEVHAELNTSSKIFCGCRNAFSLDTNTQCCPVCMGMPGTLPVLNESVVDYAVKMGHALHCTIHTTSRMDRKNYCYPDLPKGYQISQYDLPLCEHGYLDVMVDGKVKRFGVARIHIEEDAGKLLHGGNDFDGTLVDMNRCGVPLIEIVSEPDLQGSADARAFLEMIRLTLLYLGISDCKMEQGSLRCDVNVSLKPKGSTVLGTRVEMKNVSSFSGAVRAIDYEAQRQLELLSAGGTIARETRRWDDERGQSVVLRNKESAKDYRFFPEPDLFDIRISSERVEALLKEIPELPNRKLIRYVEKLGLSQREAMAILTSVEKAMLFEEIVKTGQCKPQTAANWILGDITRIEKESGKPVSETGWEAVRLAELFSMVEAGEVSSTAGKQLLTLLLSDVRTPKELVQVYGLAQVSDEAVLKTAVFKVMELQEKAVRDYLGGKTHALGFLVGQCMKVTNGKGNPGKLKEILIKALEEM